MFWREYKREAIAITAIAFFAIFAMIGTASATTFYVNATSGDDDHNNTQAQDPDTPWATISHAVTNATDGGTINVTGGGDVCRTTYS